MSVINASILIEHRPPQTNVSLARWELRISATSELACLTFCRTHAAGMRWRTSATVLFQQVENDGPQNTYPSTHRESNGSGNADVLRTRDPDVGWRLGWSSHTRQRDDGRQLRIVTWDRRGCKVSWHVSTLTKGLRAVLSDEMEPPVTFTVCGSLMAQFTVVFLAAVISDAEKHS